MIWAWVTVAYFAYLLVVSMVRAEFARARAALILACMVGAATVALAPRFSTTLDVIVPALLLLAGYRITGLFFVRVDSRIERRLLESDHRWLRRTGILHWYDRAPRAVVELFEASYLLVYAAVPAGAATLALGGHGGDVGRFWTIVLVAEFCCYGVLPWVQTRPPMLVEAAPAGQRSAIRRLNQLIASRASIRANSIPSGHAAGSLATALAVGEVMPAAGVAFLALAISIAAASVLGRYHYVVDSLLGVLVAVAVWLAI